jgi:hypothetical protein
MDVLQLLPSKEAAGRGCRDLLCAVCGAAVEMFLDEKGHQTGNMEQKKENQRVRGAAVLGWDGHACSALVHAKSLVGSAD